MATKTVETLGKGSALGHEDSGNTGFRAVSQLCRHNQGIDPIPRDGDGDRDGEHEEERSRSLADTIKKTKTKTELLGTDRAAGAGRRPH